MKISKEIYIKAFERLWLMYSYGKINFERFVKRLKTLNRYFVITVLLFFTPTASAEVIDVSRLADAIYKAENSTKYPYGIKSIDTKGDEVYARRICINTIRNNIKRYEKSDKSIDYITFLGNRYCPSATHPLNTYWMANVKYYYYKKGKR